MKAVIYTKDDQEYTFMSKVLQEEVEPLEIARDPLDGYAHFETPYDIVIVALEGAKGMNTVLEWSDRYPESRIIWLTSDPDFIRIAFRRRLRGFLIRPYDESRFREAVRNSLR